jgi:uncharacterized phage-associated protein
MTQFAPLTIANTFIKRHGGSIGISHMKLQKLTYYAHCWHLAYRPESLINEKPQVWQYGPVFKSLYNSLKLFGMTPIKTPQTANPFAQPEELPEGFAAFIDWIWERYGSFSATTLSDMTHEAGTPWRILAEQHNFIVPKDFTIPDDLIKKCFEKEASEFAPA